MSTLPNLTAAELLELPIPAVSATELLELCSLVYKPPLILVTSIFLHEITYRSYAIRVTVFGVIVYSLLPLSQTHTIQNPHLSYALGMLRSFLFMLSTVMLLFYDPAQEFKRVPVWLTTEPKKDSTSSSDFPSKPSLDRLSWIISLLIDVRGIGWNFGSKFSLLQIKSEFQIPSTNPNPSGNNSALQTANTKRLESKFLHKRLIRVGIDATLLILWRYPFYSDPFLSGQAEVLNPLSLFDPDDRTKWFILLPYRTFISGLRLFTAVDLGSNFLAILFVIGGETRFGS